MKHNSFRGPWSLRDPKLWGAAIITLLCAIVLDAEVVDFLALMLAIRVTMDTFPKLR